MCSVLSISRRLQHVVICLVLFSSVPCVSQNDIDLIALMNRFFDVRAERGEIINEFARVLPMYEQDLSSEIRSQLAEVLKTYLADRGQEANIDSAKKMLSYLLLDDSVALASIRRSFDGYETTLALEELITVYLTPVRIEPLSLSLVNGEQRSFEIFLFNTFGRRLSYLDIDGQHKIEFEILETGCVKIDERSGDASRKHYSLTLTGQRGSACRTTRLMVNYNGIQTGAVCDVEFRDLGIIATPPKVDICDGEDIEIRLSLRGAGKPISWTAELLKNFTVRERPDNIRNMRYGLRLDGNHAVFDFTGRRGVKRIEIVREERVLKTIDVDIDGAANFHSEPETLIVCEGNTRNIYISRICRDEALAWTEDQISRLGLMEQGSSDGETLRPVLETGRIRVQLKGKKGLDGLELLMDKVILASFDIRVEKKPTSPDLRWVKISGGATAVLWVGTWLVDRSAEDKWKDYLGDPMRPGGLYNEYSNTKDNATRLAYVSGAATVWLVYEAIRYFRGNRRYRKEMRAWEEKCMGSLHLEIDGGGELGEVSCALAFGF